MVRKAWFRYCNHCGASDFDEIISILQPELEKILGEGANTRWISLKLLDGDSSFNDSMKEYLKIDLLSNPAIQKAMEKVAAYLEEMCIRDRVRPLEDYKVDRHTV